VFASEGFYELYNALKKNIDAGRPAHHLATYTVLENQYEGVPGGWQVCVLLLVMVLLPAKNDYGTVGAKHQLLSPNPCQLHLVG
jgi:hypothetical protein